MTYQELEQLIGAMTPEQRLCDVTIFDRVRVEFFPVEDARVSKEEDPEGDVLDKGHPYLVIG